MQLEGFASRPVASPAECYNSFDPVNELIAIVAGLRDIGRNDDSVGSVSGKLGPDITPSAFNLLCGCDPTPTLPFRPDISFATATGHIIRYRHCPISKLTPFSVRDTVRPNSSLTKRWASDAVRSVSRCPLLTYATERALNLHGWLAHRRRG